MTVDLCPSCDGSGEDDVSGLDCPRCTGVGMVDDRDEEWDGFVEADEDDEWDEGERAGHAMQPA